MCFSFRHPRPPSHRPVLGLPSLLTLWHICDACVSPGGYVHHLLVSHSVAETEVKGRCPTGWLESITHWPKRISSMMDVRHCGICNQNLSPGLNLHHCCLSVCVCVTFSTAESCVRLQPITQVNQRALGSYTSSSIAVLLYFSVKMLSANTSKAQTISECSKNAS